MLLEMDSDALVQLVQSPEALEGKIKEALKVLQDYAAQQPQQ